MESSLVRPSSGTPGVPCVERDKLVFVVDDEPAAFNLVKKILEAANYRTVCMDDPEMMLRLLKYNRPDLIIMDVMMPGMDGWELFSQVRLSKLNKNTPVIFLTCTAMEMDEVQLASSADRCRTLAKPARGPKLLSVIADLLSQGD